MDKSLMRYVPKFYKPFVKDIKRGEKFWNDITKRWNYSIIVTWNVNGDEEDEEFANGIYMFNLLKEFGGDIIDQMLGRAKII